MFLPSSHQIAPQRVSTRVIEEPGISNFCPLYFPPIINTDKKRSFRISRGALVCDPILTSESLISHVLAQNLMDVSNSQKVHTSKLNSEFCVMCPTSLQRVLFARSGGHFSSLSSSQTHSISHIQLLLRTAQCSSRNSLSLMPAHSAINERQPEVVFILAT